MASTKNSNNISRTAAPFGLYMDMHGGSGKHFGTDSSADDKTTSSISSTGTNGPETIPVPSDYEIFSAKIAKVCAASSEKNIPGSELDVLIREIEKTAMIGYRRLDEKEKLSRQPVVEVEKILQDRQERLRRQEESSTLLINDLADLNESSNDSCGGEILGLSISTVNAAADDSDFPSAWKRTMDQLFARLKAIPDDQETLSDFHHAVSFARYSVGHRMTRFIQQSRNDVHTLKSLQREIIKVESRLRNLRTSKLRECDALDPLALLLFVEDKIFSHFCGYQSALNEIVAEERDGAQTDGQATRQQKWQAALMSSPTLEKALNSALSWAKSVCDVGPLPEIAAKTVELLESENAGQKAERQTRWIFDGVSRSTDYVLINKRHVGLVGGDFLVGICHFVGVSHLVEYGVVLVDGDYPDCVEATTQTD